MKKLHGIAFILLIIGGLNWGLSALGWDVLGALLGGWPVVLKVVYLLVGLSAVYEVATHKANCKSCNAGTAM